MKILYHHRVRSKDGQGIHISELIAGLRAQGHQVIVVEPTSFSHAKFGGESVFLTWIKRYFFNGLFELLELAYNVPVYFRLRRAWNETEPDIIYERYSLYLLAGIWMSRRRRTPLLLEVNAPLAEERGAYGGIGLPRLAAFLEAWAWRNAACVMPVTYVLANKIIRAGVPPERSRVIPNAINPARFHDVGDGESMKNRLGLSGKTVLGFTGFMREWHRLDTILDLLVAADTRPDLHLLLVGEGPARKSLEDRTRQLGLESRVTFAGLINHDEVTHFVASFDIALQPATVDYASPLKLFEYMALGKAIIAPNQPNIREILTHEVDAILFAPGSPEAMATAILRLAGDATLRDKLGRAARATIANRRLTWADNATQVSEIAMTLLQKYQRNRGVEQTYPPTGSANPQ